MFSFSYNITQVLLIRQRVFVYKKARNQNQSMQVLFFVLGGKKIVFDNISTLVSYSNVKFCFYDL